MSKICFELFSNELNVLKCRLDKQDVLEKLILEEKV
jgi:hypothetical protein